MSTDELEKLVITLEEEMFAAAEELRFEYAAKLRDEIKDLRRELTAAASRLDGRPVGRPSRFPGVRAGRRAAPPAAPRPRLGAEPAGP